MAAAIREFGFLVPIVVQTDGTVIDGHLRLKAAKKLGLESVPVIPAENLSPVQIKAFRIAVNQMASLADWDDDLLRLELDGLEELGFDVDKLGFSESELNDLLADDDTLDGNPYSIKIDAPTYEPSDEKPDVDDLTDCTKTRELLAAIHTADMPEAEKRFLRLAAERHTVFNFARIADYYSNSDAEVQSLMEASALVIIDYAQAVENGFVQIQKDMTEQQEDEASAVA